MDVHTLLTTRSLTTSFESSLADIYGFALSTDQTLPVSEMADCEDHITIERHNNCCINVSTRL